MNNFEKVLFVVNPISGGKDKSLFLNYLNVLIEQKKFSIRIFFTTGRTDEFFIRQEIERFSPNVVAAVGGDGTASLISRILVNTDIPMAIIPFGSANGMAVELGIPSNPQLAVEGIFSGEIKKIDLLKVNNQIILHIGDVGINAQVVKRFEKENKRGFLGYGKQLFRELLFVRTHQFKIYSNNEVFKRRAIMLVIANASKYGSGAIINPKGKLDDGKLELCIIKPFAWYHAFSFTYKIFTGKIETSRFMEIISTDKAKITCKKKLNLQLDGEIIGKMREIKVETIPASLNIIVPHSF